MIHDNQYSQSEAELDFLNILFESEPLFPWNPEALESDVYFEELEARCSFVNGFTDAELEERSQGFMNNINQLWSATRLQKSLLEQFASQVPQEVLSRLAQVATGMAQQVSARSLSLAEQLVCCVQELLPQWPEEDLQVLARPFAYAMRGGELEGMEGGSAIVGSACWSELSEIEQARTCLVIARYALSEILSDQENS